MVDIKQDLNQLKSWKNGVDHKLTVLQTSSPSTSLNLSASGNASSAVLSQLSTYQQQLEQIQSRLNQINPQDSKWLN